MPERLSAVGVALAALAFCAVLFWPRPPPAAVSQPLSTAAGPAGLKGLYTWLGRAHVHVHSLRRHYRALLHARLPPRGNLLLVSLPARWPADPAEVTTLRRWVRRGNDVLVLAALDDHPGWSRHRSDGSAERFVRHLTGAVLVRTDTHRRSTGDGWRPRGGHPLLQGVGTVDPGPTAGPSRWRLQPPRGHAALHLLAGAGDRGGLWELRVGAGRVWVASASGLFANAALAHPGNARLAANLVRLAVGPGGAVVVDDMHQGLTRVYDPHAFYRDPRMHWTLGFLLALWLLYVAGRSGRLGPPLDDRPAPGAGDLALAAGGLYARALRPQTAALERLRYLRKALQPRLGVVEGERLWRRLAQTPGIDAADVRRLCSLERAAAQGGRVDLARVHNLCLRIDRELK